eukprot:TRINITY_DN11412_c0_g1_i2.p1 TRINITY_DN11412_c0_g1~~TRINITY_DN11412_c0_g1_i2.p1  ORF type:complete len:348 (+),score=35.95 TRINITY_DN11412_c0_g1_i2:241-1284(+)
MSKMIRKSRDGCKKKPELEIDCDDESISAEVAASARLVLGRYDKQLHDKLAREKPGHTCTKCGRPMKGHSAATCPNCLDDRSNPEHKKICDCKAFYKKFPHCDDISELRKQEDMQKRIPFEDLPPEYARLFHQTQSLILPFEHLKDYFGKTVVFSTKMQMEHSSRYDYKPARTIRVMWASARKHQLMALKCVIWPLCTRRPVSELEWQNSEREMYQQTQVEQDDIMRGKLPLRIEQADELTITPETSPMSIACFLESCFSSTMKSNIPLHNKLIMWAIAKAPRFVERYFALVRQLQNKNDQMTFNWDQFRQPVLELQDSDELQFGPTIESPCFFAFWPESYILASES